MIGLAKAAFFAAHLFSHVLMFGLLLANGFASGRGAIAQFGCLPYGSLLANQRRQSAIRHRLVNCPSCGGQCTGGRWQATAQWASRSRGFATPGWHSWSFAHARMHRGRAHQCGPPSP